MNPAKMSTSAFMQTVALRRSIYALNATSPISDARILDLTHQTLRGVPSAFNSQTTRLVVLLKAEHVRFWAMARDVFLADVQDDKAKEALAAKMDGYAKAYGSILFFENTHTIQTYQTRAPTYASQFPLWSEHTSGMHQYVLWTALTAEGLGCNLQHYHVNADVERRARGMYDVPQEWALKAQLVFGGVEDGARPTEAKEKIDVEETCKVFGAELS